MIGRIMIIALLISWTQETYGIIGHDCSSSLANITTMSLLNIEEYDISSQKMNKILKYILYNSSKLTNSNP